MPHDFQPLLDYAFTIGIELTGTRWIAVGDAEDWKEF